MYFATPPALHVRSSSNFVSRSILLLRGWQNIYGDVFADDSLTEVSCPRQRHCTVRLTDWVEPDARDIAVFYDHSLTSTPPHRILGQLWVYHAGESQITLEVDHIENWDEYFNYTHDFREDATLKKFAKKFWKLDQPYTQNFTAEKLKRMNANALPEAALRFVSNCHPVSSRYRVTSGRIEYAHDLYFSGACNISAYTRTQDLMSVSNINYSSIRSKKRLMGWSQVMSSTHIILPSKTLSVKTISLKNFGKY